jgi:hypothetical protein
MSHSQGHAFPTAIFVTTAIFLSSVVSIMACFGLRKLYGWASAALCLAPLLLLPVSLVILIVLVVWSARSHRISKMEAWWWLSAPYAATVPLGAVVFHIQEGDGTLMLLAIGALVATLSSIAWMLTMIYQLAFSRKALINARLVLMMAIVLLAYAAWAAGYK